MNWFKESMLVAVEMFVTEILSEESNKIAETERQAAAKELVSAFISDIGPRRHNII